MAKKITVELVDDYDGQSAASETVNFALDGINYEIDLSDANAATLRAALGPWAEKARRVGGRRVAHRPPNRQARDSDAIRAWAEANGHKVARRGRINRDVIAAYDADQDANKSESVKKPAANGSRVENALAKARAKKQSAPEVEQPQFSSTQV